MKNTRSNLIKTAAILLVIAVFAAFAVILCACDNNSGAPQNPDSDSFIYKQAEHIGWRDSLSKFSNSAYSDYYNNGEPAFVIPGLNKGQNFVLQGIAYCQSRNWSFLCGYVNPETDKPNSVIFVMDMSQTATSSTGHVYNGVLIKEIFLKNSDNTVFKGHAGGIAATGKNIWIANGGKLHRISLSAIENAPKSGELAFEDSIAVPVLSSYCSYTDGILWVGEFEYAKDGYVTETSHHYPDNASLKAWTVGYEIDESGNANFDEITGFKKSAMGNTLIPDFVLWHGEKVQGMAEAGNKIVLSTSYGRKNDSAIYIYNNPVHGNIAADCVVNIGGADIPCYILSTADKKVVAPPMTEDLSVIKSNEAYKLLVASESGAYYYHGHNVFNQSKNATDFVWLYTVQQ